MKTKIRRCLVRGGVGLTLLLGSLLCTTPSRAQAGAARSDSVQTRFVFDPLSLYRPSGGFGVGGRLETVNLGRPGSRLTVEAYVAQHRGEYAITFAPRDLLLEGTASAFMVRYETQGRLSYHGVGPRTRENTRVFVATNQIEGGAYAGMRRGALGVLGSARALTGVVTSFRDDTDDAFDRLDEHSAFLLEQAVDARVSGLALGATLYADARDNLYRPTRGVLVAAGTEVFTGTPTAFVQPHARFTAHTSRGAALFSLRGLAVVTRPLDPDASVPFLLLPRFDNRFAFVKSSRLAGRDLVLVDLTVQHPLRLVLDERVAGEIATDVFALVGAYNAYDDLFSDVRWTPSWSDRFGETGPTPLRAVVGGGVHAYDPKSGKPLYAVGLGITSDGLTFYALTFTLDPRQLRPLWRW